MSSASRPELIAHRGAPRERPENTLTGFRRALELGAEALELDVHGTRDGVLVVHHDAVLPDGRSIAEMDASMLASYDVHGEAIPRLEDVFDATGARARIYVEVKGAGITPLVAAAVARSPGPVAVHSFDHRIPRALRDAGSPVSTGVLLSSYLIDVVGSVLAAGADTLWMEAALLDEDLVRECQGAGLRVIAWTVNSAATMRLLTGWGVDGICTDEVSLLRRTLADIDRPCGVDDAAAAT